MKGLAVCKPPKQTAEMNISDSGLLSLHCLPSLEFYDGSDVLAVQGPLGRVYSKWRWVMYILSICSPIALRPLPFALLLPKSKDGINRPRIGCLEKRRTNLGLVSQYCPPFVQLQGEIEIV